MDQSYLTNRQKQAIETEKKIFDVANELVNRIPFNKLTIRKICDEANISIGTFYLYYKSKKDILFEIYKTADRFFDQIDLSEMRDKDSFKKIEIIIDAQLSVKASFEIIKNAYIHHFDSDNDYFFSENRSFFIILNKIIEDGQKDKEIRTDLGSRDITWKILRFTRGIIFDWLIHDGNYDIKKTGLDELKLYLQVFRHDFMK